MSDVVPTEYPDTKRDTVIAQFQAEGVWQGEVKQTHKDGKELHVLASVVLVRDDSGTPTGILATNRDITERKQAEQALHESEGRYRSYIERANDGIAVVRHGKLLFVNARLAEMIGYAIDEIEGKEFVDFIPSDIQSQMLENYRRRLAGEPVASVYESRILHKNGTEIHVEYNVGMVRVRDEPAALAMVRDITARKQAEEEQETLQTQLVQAQKMESVGRLAGGVAHDLNNTLTAIQGYSELLLNQLEPDHSMHDDLNEIHTAARRSADITQQLLAFARRQIIQPQVLDLNDCVADLTKMLRRLIGENIEMNWRPGARVWPVEVDPGQMHQLLANLCVNARDAIDDVGCVSIETQNVTIDEAYCQTYPYAQPGRYVMLAVSDDGCGMDRETVAHIFEPFFTTKEVGEGTGLGLSTVYGIVKQNRGFINVYSEEGVGTTFKVYLPRYAGLDDVESSAERVVLPQRGSGSILLVEDEVSLLGMGQRMLEALGYEVSAVATPSEALRLAHESDRQFDLLLTDVVMPEMNGRKLSKQLATLCPGIKVVYMSGYTANAIAHHGVLDEGTHFLQKPFTIQQIADTVKQALEE